MAIHRNHTALIGVARLSDKQCECLDLVLQHLTSKQIAQRLGISHHTVNQRLDTARRVLGVETRLAAALAYGDAKSIPEPIVYDRPPVHESAFGSDGCEVAAPYRMAYDPAAVGKTDQSNVVHRQPGDSQLLTLEDAAASVLLPPWDKDAILRPFAGPLAGTSEKVRRLVLILGLSMLMMAVVVVGLAVAQSLSNLLPR